MTFLNEGETDRGVRILAGILLIVAGRTLSMSTLGVVLLVVSAIALATGLVGWCSAYSALGVSTGKAPAGHCPHWATEHVTPDNTAVPNGSSYN